MSTFTKKEISLFPRFCNRVLYPFARQRCTYRYKLTLIVCFYMYLLSPVQLTRITSHLVSLNSVLFIIITLFTMSIIAYRLFIYVRIVCKQQFVKSCFLPLLRVDVFTTTVISKVPQARARFQQTSMSSSYAAFSQKSIVSEYRDFVVTRRSTHTNVGQFIESVYRINKNCKNKTYNIIPVGVGGTSRNRENSSWSCFLFRF